MFLLTVCCCKLVVHIKVILRRQGWQRGDSAFEWKWLSLWEHVQWFQKVWQLARVSEVNELKYWPQMQCDAYLAYLPTCFTVVGFRHHIQCTACYISLILLNILNSFTTCTSSRTSCRRAQHASYNEAGVLSIAALPLRWDLKSEDILVCKPTENILLLHFGSAAVFKDQTSNDTFGIPECLPAAAVLTEPSPKLCQLLGILLYPSGVKPASSRQSSTLHVE